MSNETSEKATNAAKTPKQKMQERIKRSHGGDMLVELESLSPDGLRARILELQGERQARTADKQADEILETMRLAYNERKREYDDDIKGADLLSSYATVLLDEASA